MSWDSILGCLAAEAVKGRAGKDARNKRRALFLREIKIN